MTLVFSFNVHVTWIQMGCLNSSHLWTWKGEEMLACIMQIRNNTVRADAADQDGSRRQTCTCMCVHAFGSGSDIEDVNRGERRARVLEVHKSLSSAQFHFNISSVQTDLPPPSPTHPFYLFISLSFAHLLTLYWLVSHWPLELVARTVSRLKSQDKTAF